MVNRDRHSNGAEPGRTGETRVTTADLAATALFALEGAAVGVAAELDLFGVLVVACVSALGGGTLRDLLIGAVPTASVRDVRYVVVSVLGGAVTFLFFSSGLDAASEVLVLLDSAGLALFAVVGATKAHDFGLPALSAALVGTVTAVGGGAMRDVLVDRVPLVLRGRLRHRCVAGCGDRGLGPRAGPRPRPGRGRGRVRLLRAAHGRAALRLEPADRLSQTVAEPARSLETSSRTS
ncbi:MAG: TRIC cation channel family protein [Microthrixaceae bacterium]